MPQTSADRRDLILAVAVAREAGTLVRDEFHREGGPRGHGGHAEIDAEAEALIRRRLLEARPGDGFLGEETGSVDPPGDGRRRWIVDPNDGTSAFLKGERGPSVSIALLVNDEPVVGVVYAYAAPDDHGDLIAGGVGLGLFRGPGDGPGDAADLPPLPTPARSDTAAGPQNPADLVAVSGSAHRTPERRAAYEELCSPWGIRPAPGVAYRLALAAAGDVRVAVTLTAPWSWDMAGGHALLRAAGGDLFARDGTPVRYDAAGHCAYSPAYFGGTREDVERIRRRRWEPLFVERPGRR